MQKKRIESLKDTDWFLWGELALFLGFLTLDLGILDFLWAGNSSILDRDFLSCILKYASVLMCYLWRIGKKDPSLERAQLLVLGADLCLLFQWHIPMGMALFLLVQLQYRIYLRGTQAWKGFLLQCALVALAAGFAGRALLRSKEELGIILLGAVYGAALLSNLYLAFRRRQPLFGAGLFLLLLCDIHVLLYNLPLVSGGFLGRWQELAGTAMWLFYLPSQLVIAKLAMKAGNLYQGDSFRGDGREM